MPSLRKHLSLFVILLILAGCGTTTRERNEKHRQEQATLARKDSLAFKVAVTPTLDCLPLFVAVHTGIFDSLHVDVSLKEKNAHIDCDEAFIAKEVECMVSDLMRTERLRQRGYALDYVTATDAYWQMLGNQKARINAIKHLGDRMIGMTRYSATDYLATLAIDSVKPPLPVFRVQLNDVSVRLMMLINNEIEAVMLTEPQATTARINKHVVLFDSRNKDIRLGVIASRGALNNDPYRKEQREQMIKGYNLACDSINERGLQHYKDLIVKCCNTDAGTVKQLPRLTYHHVSPPRQKDIDKTKNVKWRTY